jgi:hypothetical protein
MLMFISDSFFQIGKSHRICEDFAMHGQIPMISNESSDFSYAIVCDGCSSSCESNGIRMPLNTDTGSRLVALSARRSLFDWLYMKDFSKRPLEDFILEGLLRQKDALMIPSSVFDSTLMIAYANNKTGHSTVMVWGDGIVVSEDPVGVKTITKIEYSTGAPFYLSYKMKHLMMLEYFRQFGVGFKSVFQKIGEEHQEIFIPVFEDRESLFHKPFVIDGFFNKITLMSDGVCQFGPKIGDFADTFKMAEELTQFPIISPSFVQRQFNIINRKMRLENTSHFDDLAMASIIKEEVK